MTSFEITHDSKSRGALTFQVKTVDGTWIDFVQIGCPKHLRYSAEVVEDTVCVYLYEKETDFRDNPDWALGGEWVKVCDEIALGHHIALKGSRSVIAKKPVKGPAWVRQSPSGEPLEIRIGSDPLSS